MVTLMGVSFVVLNGIIALCLVGAKDCQRSRHAAVLLQTSLELPASNEISSMELKGGPLLEAYCPPAELHHDAVYEMYVLPGEVTGDSSWPELDGTIVLDPLQRI